MTENKRFQIIHLGNPYDFVVKDHATNKTYGTLQGDDKSLTELLDGLAEENKQLKSDNFNLNKSVEYLYKLVDAVDEHGDVPDDVGKLDWWNKAKYDKYRG